MEQKTGKKRIYWENNCVNRRPEEEFSKIFKGLGCIRRNKPYYIGVTAEERETLRHRHLEAHSYTFPRKNKEGRTND